jgi:hypothetical protein
MKLLAANIEQPNSTTDTNRGIIGTTVGITNRKGKDIDKQIKFNVRRLHWYCTKSIKHIMKNASDNVEIIEIGNSRHAYIDNGGDVLAVAHLDVSPSIQKFRKSFYVCGRKIFSPSLDDRLGAYLICDFLPRMGLTYDILLTEDEEVGLSTAMDFIARKDYNWIFEFDRRGDDVVMYQFHDSDMADLLETSGFKVGTGSFTDICELDNLGCKGFNFGTGYHLEHSRRCYANLKITAHMVKLFIEFFKANSHIHYPHDEADNWYSSRSWSKGSWKYGKYGAGWESTDDDYHDYMNWSGRWWKDQDDEDRLEKTKTELFDKAATVYENTRTQLIQTYGSVGNLDHMDWQMYCEIMGIDINNTLSWTDDDWLIYSIIGDH